MITNAFESTRCLVRHPEAAAKRPSKDTGGGRSGGYRTLIALQAARRSVFLYGFAKSERDNINTKKLAELKALARRFVSLTDAEIEKLLNANDIRELECHEQEQED